MTGWSTIKKIRKFEERATKLGFEIIEPALRNHSYANGTTISGNSFWIDELSGEKVNLAPVDNRYPSWRRGSSVFAGSIEEGEFFLQGVEFAHISDSSIGLTSDKKRAQAEAKHIERQRKLEAAREKKAEQKRMWQLLKYGAQEEDEAVPF